MRHAHILMALLLATATGHAQNAWMKTATLVDGGHRLDVGPTGAHTLVPASLTNNLIVMLTFNVDDGLASYDLSASGNDASIGVGTGPTVADGYADFNGTDELLTMGDKTAFSFGNGSVDTPCTISVWAAPDANNARALWKDETGKREYEFYVRNGSDQFDFRFFDSSAGGRIGRIYDVSGQSYGAWHHYCGTYDGSRSSSGITLYIDGTLVISSDNASGSYTATENTASDLTIGEGYGAYYNGKMDDLRIYRRELSSNDVFTVYSQGRK